MAEIICIFTLENLWKRVIYFSKILKKILKVSGVPLFLLLHKEYGGSSSEQTARHSSLQHGSRAGQVGPLPAHDQIPQSHWFRGDGDSAPNTHYSGEELKMLQ